MSRFLGKLFHYLLIALFLCIVGVAIFLWTFDLNRYKGMIERKATEALGRTVTIDSASLKVSVIPTIKLDGITVANSAGFDNRPFAKIDSMEASLLLPALIKDQKIELMDFALGTATIVLQDKKGKNNWTFGSDNKQKSSLKLNGSDTNTSNYLEQFSIASLSVKNIAVTYEKDDLQKKVAVTDFSMQQLKAFSGNFFYDGYSAAVSGIINPITDLLLKKPDYAFNLTVKAFEAESKISGRIGNVSEFSDFVFDVTVQGSELEKTYSKLFNKTDQFSSLLKGAYNVRFMAQGNMKDISFPTISLSVADEQYSQSASGRVTDFSENLKWSIKTTSGLKDGLITRHVGLKPITMSIVASGNKSVIDVSEAMLVAGKTDVLFQGNVQLAKVPSVTGNLISEYFDWQDLVFAADLSDSEPVEKQTAAKESLFSEQPIDLSVLKKVNAKLNVDLQHFRLPNEFSNYMKMRAVLKSDQGILTIDPFYADLIGGKLSGKGTLNSTVSPAQLKIDLSADKLNLSDIKSMNGYLNGGQMNVAVDLSAQGNSIKEIMGNLSGNVTAEISSADITNRNFVQLLKATDMFPIKAQNAFSYSEADVENKLICSAFNMNFDKGQINLKRNIALETSLINFILSGQIDLKNEKMSISFEPSLGHANPKLNQALNLTQNLVIEGPFSQPKINVKQSAENMVSSIAKAAVENVLEKQADKVGIPVQKQSNAVTPYTLCEAALGRKMVLREDMVSSEPVVTPTVEKAPIEPVVLDPKDQFKQQLFESLSEVLRKK